MQCITCKTGGTAEEAYATYSACVASALKQEQPGNKYSNLAHIGSCVGTISFVILLFTALATHLNLFFIIMAIVAASFVGTCNGYVKKKNCRIKRKDAIKFWAVHELEQELVRMEKLFDSKK